MAERTQKRGLGTGLSALFGDSSMELSAENELKVAIEKVEPRADQPRIAFDNQALQELSESIAQYGIIQPITVRRLDSGYFQIIAGERRWRAARLAGLKEVPVRIIEADDKRAMELALVENLQREDLNPIEEAKGFRKLMEEYGMNQDETSQSVGKSRPAIANALRLLNLTKPVMKLVEEGKLSAGHARALLVIKDADSQLKAADRVCEDNLSVRKTESMAARIALENEKAREIVSSQPEVTITVNYLADAEKRLTNAMGRKVAIRNGMKKGKIELEFYGNEDRESLIDMLLSLDSGRAGAI